MKVRISLTEKARRKGTPLSAAEHQQRIDAAQKRRNNSLKRVKEEVDANSWSGYGAQELRRHGEMLTRIEKQSLGDRKASTDYYLETVMKDTPYIAKMAKDLLMGDFGEGARLASLRVLASPANANKRAQLNQLVAAYGFGVPARHLNSAWKSLKPEKQVELNSIFDKVIEDYLDQD